MPRSQITSQTPTVSANPADRYSLFTENCWRRRRRRGFGERTTGDRRSLPPPLLRERYLAGVTEDSILSSDPPETIRGHALNTSLASASRLPLMRKGTKRRREPSADLTSILDKWLQFGLRVTALRDSIRQIQRRVILLRLRKASADGILSHIAQTLHECVQHTHPPAFIGAF